MRCSQSRVGILASTGRRLAVLGCNVTRGRLSYRAASSDILNVNQWACFGVHRGRVELEESDFGVLPGLGAVN